MGAFGHHATGGSGGGATALAGLTDVSDVSPAIGQVPVFNSVGKWQNLPTWFNVKAFNAKGDGVTDDTTAVINAITAAYNAGGGIVYFPPGVYLILGQIVIPDNGSAAGNHFGSIRLTGAGYWGAGGSVVTAGTFGTSLDLRYGFVRTVTDGVVASRVVTDAVLNSSTTVTSATAVFTASDVGRSISATGIPGGTTIAAYVSATQVTMSAAATATATGVTLTVGGSVNLTSATAAFTAADVGRFVVGAGVPWRTQILSVTNGTTAVLTTAATAGSALSLTFNDPKIYSPGAGLLELDHLNLVDGGTDTAPYLLATKTVIKAHDLRVEGNPSKSIGTCDQDVFILGGTLTTYNHTPNDQFSGYVSQVSNVIFSRIRAGLVARTFANAVVARDCWFDGTCGGAVGAAAFESWAPPGQNTIGFTLLANVIECNSYTYGVNLTNSAAATIVGSQFYDAGANGNFVACVNADAQSTNTLLVIGYRDVSRGVAIQDASNTARVFDATAGFQWSNNLKIDSIGNVNQTGGGVITTNGAMRATAISDLNNNRTSINLNTDATHLAVLSGQVAAKIPFSVAGFTGQTAGLQEWQSVPGTAVANVDVNGNFTGNGIRVGQSATAVAVATSGTIATNGPGLSRVSPTGAVTGVILQSGTVNGQLIFVVNEAVAANSVTFAASATSHVADGTSDVIPGLTSRGYVWDSGVSLWFPVK